MYSNVKIIFLTFIVVITKYESLQQHEVVHYFIIPRNLCLYTATWTTKGIISDIHLSK